MAEEKEIDYDALIESKYDELIKHCRNSQKEGNEKRIRKAFELAVEAHKEMKRRSGEPFVLHPIEVAIIVVTEIGLGTTSAIAALLHDVVEDTDIPIETLEEIFGSKVANIVEGLTKITGITDKNISLQAENFRKVLLTLADDVRVIILKIADRLHNMRTLDAMPRHKQLKIASETMYMYAPLAHRLGLYSIKTELEDLSFKYTNPIIYRDIKKQVEQTEKGRKLFIQRFSLPISAKLSTDNINFQIKGRTKSIYSIWKKMQAKNIPFEQVYDLFAIRIIVDSNFEKEKDECWKVYSIVTDYYRPNPTRLRDWITTPKANGYEALHTTVLAEKGKWVEVQIRTNRMDEIAEKGFAAHWRYKDSNEKEGTLDQWLRGIRDTLENLDDNALDFIDDFKLSLFYEEITVFTPAGDPITLPKNATVLDLAFEIHTELGEQCISAKVNQKLVPISYVLESGDNVEIITSQKQDASEAWLKYVITSKAKTGIKNVIKKNKKKVKEKGREVLIRKLGYLKQKLNDQITNDLLQFFKLEDTTELFYQIYNSKITIKDLKRFVEERKNQQVWFKIFRKKVASKMPGRSLKEIVIDAQKNTEDDTLTIGDSLKSINYSLATCCNPIPGDEIFGFTSINDGVKIHKSNCQNAIHLMSRYTSRIIKAKWEAKESMEFLSAIKIEGLDDVGIAHQITGIISRELNVNIRSLSLNSKDGYFHGTIHLYVNNTKHLKSLITKIKNIKSIKSVKRVEATL